MVIAFIWLLTIGTIGGLVYGVIERTKELHARGTVITDDSGNVVQVSSSDFVPDSNGMLVMRDSQVNLKIDVMKSSFNLTAYALIAIFIFSK